VLGKVDYVLGRKFIMIMEQDLITNLVIFIQPRPDPSKEAQAVLDGICELGLDHTFKLLNFFLRGFFMCCVACGNDFIDSFLYSIVERLMTSLGSTIGNIVFFHEYTYYSCEAW